MVRWLALAALLSGCASGPAPAPEPDGGPIGWLSVQHPLDPIQLRMPWYMTPRNDVGCYRAPLSSAGGVVGGSLFDFCVVVMSTSEAASRFPVREGRDPDCTMHCWIYQSVQTRSTTLGSYSATVQTYLASGGGIGYSQVPSLLAQVQIGRDSVVIFQGETPSPADANLLLRIASTVGWR